MRDRYGQIITAFKGVRVQIFCLACAVFMIALMAASVRLKLIIAAQDITVTFYEALSLTLIGYFFNNFLPTSIGGDLVKAYYLSKKTTEKTGPFSAVFVDRALGLFTMIFMAAIALAFVTNRTIGSTVRYSIYAITAFSIFAIFFMGNRTFARKFSGLLKLARPLEDKMRKLYNSINRYKHHKIMMAQSLVISVVSQLFFFASIWLLAVSIGSNISLLTILLCMPIISTMSLLPSINGLGLREGATVIFFGPIMGAENAFALSILWLFLLLIISLIGGLFYWLSPQFKVHLKDIN